MDLAPDLLRLRHDDYLPRDVGHHPAEAVEFVEGGGTALEVQAIRTDKKLIEVVRPQNLLRQLPLKAFRFRVPGAARSEERRVGKQCRSRWSPYLEKKRSA